MKLEVKAWLIITILTISVAITAIVLSIKRNKNASSGLTTEVSNSTAPNTSTTLPSNTSSPQTPTLLDGSETSQRFDWYPGR